jgi:Uma2 family endonuclease
VRSPQVGKERASFSWEELPIYARELVRQVWLVDPIQRTLDVLRVQDEKWLLVAVHANDARVRAEPFDAIELDLSILWADIAFAPR